MNTKPNITKPTVRRATLVAAVPALTLATLLAGAGAAHAATHPIGPDYNGDGKCDLTVGAPAESVDGISFAGAVHVMPGSASGPTFVNQFWTQNSPGVPGSSEVSDAFGDVVAHGDFNGDGKDDLAVGAPNEAFGSQFGAGQLDVLYGSGTGLTGTGSQGFTELSDGIPGDAGGSHFFAGELAAGDFNGDGKDDLAVWIAGPDTRVIVLWGSPKGLTTANLKTLPAPVNDPSFGRAMAAADFNGDGKDDLAIGAPDESVLGFANAGRVRIYGGAASFPGTTQFVDEQVVPGSLQAGSRFGGHLAAGRLGTDGKADLVIGVPEFTVAGQTGAGKVVVVRGAANGLSVADAQTFDRGTAGVPLDATYNERFGEDAAIGDFTGDGKGDLVVGAPGRTVNGHYFAGSAVLLRGNAGTVSATKAAGWDRSAYGQQPGSMDAYGNVLTACDTKGTGVSSLVAGIPHQTVQGKEAAGSVLLLAGGDAFPATAGKGINESTNGVATDPVAQEVFGTTLG